MNNLNLKQIIKNRFFEEIKILKNTSSIKDLDVFAILKTIAWCYYSYDKDLFNDEFKLDKFINEITLEIMETICK